MRSAIILGAVSALSFVAADFPLDPNVVDPTTRNQWCSAQYTSCDTLCGGNAPTNDCDPISLKYSCKCPDGKSPALDKYLQTMPTFICEKAFEVCNAANVGNAIGQKNCTTSIKDECGSLDPTKAQVGGNEESSAPTTTGAPQTSASNAAAPTSTSTGGAMATNVAVIGNGLAAVAAGVLAAALL
ncbi:hypothetical protein V8F33_000259 [Rhypophila sp. PSN 637]